MSIGKGGMPRQYTNEEILAEIRRVSELLGGKTPTKRFFDQHSRTCADTASRYFGSWVNALKQAGLRIEKRQTHYSDEDCMENLLSVWKLLGRMPTTYEIGRPPSKIRQLSYRIRWGKWKDTLTAFKRYIASRPGVSDAFRLSVRNAVRAYRNRDWYTDENLLSEIRKVSRKLGGRSVRTAAFEAMTGIGHHTIRDHFGSWWQAMEKAGVPVGKWQRKKWSEDECYENLLAVWTHYGRLPTIAEMDKPPSKIIAWVYRPIWGNWVKAVAAFQECVRSDSQVPDDLRRLICEPRPVVPKRPHRSFTREDVLLAIHQTAESLDGGVVTQYHLRGMYGIHWNAIRKHFGTLSNALQTAGVPHNKAPKHHSNDECYQNLQTVWIHLGRRPKAIEMDEPPSEIGQDTYERKWGTWDRAVVAFLEQAKSDAEFLRIMSKQEIEAQLSIPPRHLYTDEEILSAIRRLAEKVDGGFVTDKLLYKESGIGQTAIRHHFGSMSHARREAGVSESPPSFSPMKRTCIDVEAGATR